MNPLLLEATLNSLLQFKYINQNCIIISLNYYAFTFYILQRLNVANWCNEWDKHERKYEKEREKEEIREEIKSKKGGKKKKKDDFNVPIENI